MYILSRNKSYKSKKVLKNAIKLIVLCRHSTKYNFVVLPKIDQVDFPDNIKWVSVLSARFLPLIKRDPQRGSARLWTISPNPRHALYTRIAGN